MPKIRIREMMGKPAVPRMSLGSELVQEPREIETVTATGEKIVQYMPGRSVCHWLVPKGTAARSNEVDVADVSEDFAATVCDERGICERVAGRPKKSAEPPPEPSD